MQAFAQCFGRTFDPATQCCVALASTSGVLLRAGPLSSADLCPDRVTNPAAPKAIGNGCGSEGFQVPDSFGSASFLNACNDHDECWGSCGQNRNACDIIFGSALAEACKKSFSTVFEKEAGQACMQVALGYVLGVQSAPGVANYSKAQNEVCDCCAAATPCPQKTAVCGSRCLDVSTGETCCGGVPCAAGRCCNGTCLSTSQQCCSGTTPCLLGPAGVCCGTACCASGQTCLNGACVSAPCPGGCPSGEICVNGTCSRCASGVSCSSRCCDTGETCCNGLTCCPAGRVCLGNECLELCGSLAVLPGQKCCNSSAANGSVCPSNATCCSNPFQPDRYTCCVAPTPNCVAGTCRSP